MCLLTEGLGPIRSGIQAPPVAQVDSQLTRPLVAKHREEIVPERYVYSGVPLVSIPPHSRPRRASRSFRF